MPAFSKEISPVLEPIASDLFFAVFTSKLKAKLPLVILYKPTTFKAQPILLYHRAKMVFFFFLAATLKYC